MFLAYAKKELRLAESDFFAKIGLENEPSIRLFEKLGFKRGKVVEVFGEVEMVWDKARDPGDEAEEQYVEVVYPLEM